VVGNGALGRGHQTFPPQAGKSWELRKLAGGVGTEPRRLERFSLFLAPEWHLQTPYRGSLISLVLFVGNWSGQIGRFSQEIKQERGKVNERKEGKGERERKGG